MDGEVALESAAKEPQACLERDRQELEAKGEKVLAAVLTYLGRHLFDRDLTAAAAAEFAGTYPSWLTRHFGKHFGRRSCFNYFSDLRLDAAKNLLAAHPELRVAEAGRLVGGLGEKRLRRLRNESGRGPADPEPAAPLVLRVPATWRRLAQGEVTLAEQEELRPQLRALYPDVFPAPPELPPGEYVHAPATGRLCPGGGEGVTVDGLKLARIYAEEEIWPLLSGLPFEAQRLVVQRYVFSSTALFDVLREKSRQEGRRDPQRGVELAELAVLSLTTAVLGDGIFESRALGWAWVGNAKRWALDFSGAEKAFEKAVEMLANIADWEASVTAGDIYALKGALRTFQRRFEEALELFGRGLAIFELTGDRRRRAEGLIARALAALCAGWQEKAISDLEEALSFAMALNDEDLCVIVGANLGTAFLYAGEFQRSLAVVRTMDRRFRELGNPLVLYHLQWIEGAAKHGLGDRVSAEAKYLSVHAGFEDLGQWLYTALIDLDLAILYAETGRAADAIRTSLAALRFFDALKLGREVMASLRLLKHAIRQQAVTEAVLRDLRSALRADPLAELVRAEPEPQAPAPSRNAL